MLNIGMCLLRKSFLTGFVLWSLLSVTGTALQQGLLTRDEALLAAYPEALVEAERIFLTIDQQQHAAQLAREEISTALVARYVVKRDGQLVGRAYIDTHIVRTKRESLLISLDANGEVKRIDVTAFLEPRNYQASERWFRQYEQQSLSDDLALQRLIRPIAGATLTALAANQAVRRVLAIDQVLESNE